MAIMHPEDDCSIIFTNKSEKEIYKQLRAQLKPRIHVFYSVQWQTQVAEKIKMGEADFVIVDPDNGILILEAKGGYRIEHSGGTWRLWNSCFAGDIRTLKESPYEQARKSMFDFVEYYIQTQNRTTSFTYASAVIFPFYNVPDNLSIEQSADNTIQFSDMNNLQKTINHVFFAYDAGTEKSTISLQPQACHEADEAIRLKQQGTNEEVPFLQGRSRKDCSKPSEKGVPRREAKREMGNRCDGILFIRRKALSFSCPGFVQRRFGQLHDLGSAGARNGYLYAGESL